MDADVSIEPASGGIEIGPASASAAAVTSSAPAPSLRARMTDRQSRETISRLLHAQSRRVVWDLPQESMLRLRAHTYQTHVGKTDEELLNVLRRNYYVGAAADWFQQAEGSFVDIQSAKRLVNRVLEEHPKDLGEIAKGLRPDAILQSRFEHPTGKEAIRPSSSSAFCIRETDLVRVVVKSAPGTQNGFRIHTAFPTSQSLDRRWESVIPVPEDFYELCARAYQGSHEEYASESEWMASAVGALRSEQKQVVLTFLEELLSGRIADIDIERVWCGAAADYGFSPGGHRIFLAEIRDVIRMVLSDAFR